MLQEHVSVNGIELYYERAGSGEALLFISGSGGDLRNRPNQFDSPLAGPFDLICYDQRGLGQTENPTGSFSMAQYADDAAALLDKLGIEKVNVIGVSFGGMVAQELVLRHPHMVAKLVLACTSSGGDGGASYPLHELSGLDVPARAERRLRIADLQNNDQWRAENLDKWDKRLNFTLQQAEAEALVIAEFCRNQSIDEFGPHKQLEARRSHDTFSRLKDINVPVLLAAGDRDGIAPLENMQALQREISNAELEVFSGGHMFLIQDKRAYPFIIEWLGGLGG